MDTPEYNVQTAPAKRNKMKTVFSIVSLVLSVLALFAFLLSRLVYPIFQIHSEGMSFLDYIYIIFTIAAIVVTCVASLIILIKKESRIMKILTLASCTLLVFYYLICNVRNMISDFVVTDIFLILINLAALALFAFAIVLCFVKPKLPVLKLVPAIAGCAGIVYSFLSLVFFVPFMTKVLSGMGTFFTAWLIVEFLCFFAEIFLFTAVVALFFPNVKDLKRQKITEA